MMHPWVSTSSRSRSCCLFRSTSRKHENLVVPHKRPQSRLALPLLFRSRTLRPKGRQRHLELHTVNLSTRETSNPARLERRRSAYENAKFPCWCSGSGSCFRPSYRVLGRWAENPGLPLAGGATRSRLVQAPLPTREMRIPASGLVS